MKDSDRLHERQTTVENWWKTARAHGWYSISIFKITTYKEKKFQDIRYVQIINNHWCEVAGIKHAEAEQERRNKGIKLRSQTDNGKKTDFLDGHRLTSFFMVYFATSMD